MTTLFGSKMIERSRKSGKFWREREVMNEKGITALRRGEGRGRKNAEKLFRGEEERKKKEERKEREDE
jgi:hypothetical protein